MTPILSFVRENSARGNLGYEVALLGDVPVGQMALGRKGIERLVNDWLSRIGVFGPGDRVVVRIGTDDDALPTARRQAGGRG